MEKVLFESRKWIKSPVFWVMVLIVAFFVGSQLSEDNFMQQLFVWPEPPQAALVAESGEMPPYGFKEDNSFQMRMQTALRALYLAAHGNDVMMPALGGFINKQVKLSDEQIALVREAFFELSGKAYDQMDYYDEFPVAASYDAFERRLDALNGALGKVFFSLDTLVSGSTERTYEDALDEYEELVYEDHVTRAYARYACDYMGIALGFFPALLAAFALGRDKRSGASSLIGSRPITGTCYVAIKYLGYVLPVCILVLLSALPPTAGAVVLRLGGNNADVFAYLSHAVLWLLPTVLCTCAFAFLISEAAGSGIVALPVLIGWWLISVARPGLVGPYPLFVSLIRFNSMRTMPNDWTAQILANRIFVMALSFAMVALTGVLYEHKRARGERYV